jgi:hypothetical protein
MKKKEREKEVKMENEKHTATYCQLTAKTAWYYTVTPQSSHCKRTSITSKGI